MYYHYLPPQQQPNLRQTARNNLIVTGNGNISIRPDIAVAELAVITENKSLSQAQQDNAQTMQQVVQSLLDLGITQENIQTTAYNLVPSYDYEDGRQIFRGYEVTNQISVQITPIERTGTVIDTAVQNGVNRVSSIQFTVDNTQSYYQQALIQALGDAQAKAKTIVETMHLTLDPTPTKIVEERKDASVPFPKMGVTAQSFATPIEPGEIGIRATVEVHYRYE